MTQTARGGLSCLTTSATRGRLGRLLLLGLVERLRPSPGRGRRRRSRGRPAAAAGPCCRPSARGRSSRVAWQDPQDSTTEDAEDTEAENPEETDIFSILFSAFFSASSVPLWFDLMPEMADAGEQHRHAVLVAGGDRVGVADRAAGLDDRRHAGLRRRHRRCRGTGRTRPRPARCP